jgi:hypothetical protein
MTIDGIISQIDAEIARLTQARALLSSAGKVSLPGKQASAAAANSNSSRGRRTLSPEARKRIADAQRKRWAAHRAKKTKSK